MNNNYKLFMKKIINVLVLALLVSIFTGCNLEDEEINTDSNSNPTEISVEKTDSDNTDTTTNILPETDDKLKFSTVDIDGNPVTEDIIKDAKVIMINFWEPWCGPCVGEMPGLEELYENYKDQGLLILGVFSTTGMEDEVREVLEECNTSYPIIYSDSNLEKYMTDYVPTTIFTDSEGNIISPEPIVGACEYSYWEDTINEYLE